MSMTTGAYGPVKPVASSNWKAAFSRTSQNVETFVQELSVQGGALQVYDWELHLCKERDLEPDAYTTSCMAFLKGMALADSNIP